MRHISHRNLLALALGAALAALAACGGTPAPAASTSEIPVTLSAKGDAAKGKLYFEGEGGCSACHSTGTEKQVGPGLAGLFYGSGPKLPDGVDYKGNLPNGQPRSEESIAAWVRAGGQGQIGVMNPHELSDEQMADLLAFLRTLKP